MGCALLFGDESATQKKCDDVLLQCLNRAYARSDVASHRLPNMLPSYENGKAGNTPGTVQEEPLWERSSTAFGNRLQISFPR